VQHFDYVNTKYIHRNNLDFNLKRERKNNLHNINLIIINLKHSNTFDYVRRVNENKCTHPTCT